MANTKNALQLSLYHYPACPFCALTRNVLKHTDLAVDQRDIQKNPHHRKDLIEGGGRQQVPCLRIESAGNVQWLYESKDIIAFLKRTASKK